MIDVSKSGWKDETIIEAEEPAAKHEEETEESAEQPAGAYVAPTHGTEFALAKIKGSLISGLHCAVGEYETALRLLQKQIALINPAPLKPTMLHVFACSKPRFSLLSNASTSDLQLVDAAGRPVVPIKLALITAVHKKGMGLTTDGNFPDAMKQFQKCIQMITLAVAANSEQEKEMKRLIKSCAEYITAMRCQVERQKQAATVKNVFNKVLE